MSQIAHVSRLNGKKSGSLQSTFSGCIFRMRWNNFNIELLSESDTWLSVKGIQTATRSKLFLSAMQATDISVRNKSSEETFLSFLIIKFSPRVLPVELLSKSYST